MPKLFGNAHQRKLLARALVRCGVPGYDDENLRTFSGGTKSLFYMNCRRLQAFPSVRQRFAGAFRRLAHSHSADIIAGIETAALSHSNLAAHLGKLPHTTIRKAAKTHGVKSTLDGADVAGRRIFLVEDIASEAKSLLHGIDTVSENGGVVVGCGVILSYNLGGADAKVENDAGVNFTTLLTLTDVLEAMRDEKKMTPEQVASVLAWNKDPVKWLEAWEASRGTTALVSG